MIHVIVWYFGLLILGFLAWPITWFIFGKTTDRGYFFSKIVGLIILAWPVWLLARLDIAPNNRAMVVMVLLIIALFSALWYWLNWQDFRKFIINNWKIIFWEEIIFLVFFGLVLIFRYLDPRILDNEKIPDYMYLRTSYYSERFPAPDPWYLGYNIVYYFGYVIMAVYAKLVGILPQIAYNLSFATTAGLMSLAVFGFLFNILKKYQWAILGVVIVCLMGNLAIFVQMWHGLAHFDWLSVSKVIPQTINEFPYFSFLRGDLQPHLLVVPIEIMFIYAIFNFYYQANSLSHWWKILILGFLLSILFMVNSWSILSCTLLLFIAFIWRYWQRNESLKIITIDLAIYFIAAIIFLIPSLLEHSMMFRGIGLNKTWSGVPLLLEVFGFYLFLIFSFLIVYWQKQKFRNSKNWFIFTVILVGLFIVIFCELFYFKDAEIYNLPVVEGTGAIRENTIFKLYFDLWILFGLISPLIIKYFWDHYRKIKWWFIIAGLLIIISLPYVVLGPISRFSDVKTKHTLDGTAWLIENKDPRADLLEWLNKIDDSQVVVQNVGRTFSDAGLIAAYSGKPTILGWMRDEAMRRSDLSEIANRQKDVESLYFGHDEKQFLGVIQKYHVSYIFISQNDIQMMKKPIFDIINKYTQVVWHNGGNYLVKVKL